MKRMITLTLLALSLCFMVSVRAVNPIRESEAPQKSETQKATVSESTSAPSTKAATTTKSTTRVTTKRRTTTAEEETTSTTITSTESSTTTSTSANNSVLFGKNKMLAIAAWTLIGIGVLVVLIVVLGGKSRRHRRPFQKSTKRYKNKSKYVNYSDRYRTNIKRK